MAGILDNKKRVMDVAVTEEGRRQMSSGKMKIEFVSFTDRHTFYEADIASGSSIASDRIFLEATSLPQDSIVFETDGSGNIVSFAGGNLEVSPDGEIYEPSTSVRIKRVASPDIFTSLTASLLKQSLDSFKNQFLIGTHPFNDVSSSFGANYDHITFDVTDDGPAASSDSISYNVDALSPGPFNDVMLFTRHTDFLPPIFSELDGTKKICASPGTAWPDLSGGRTMDTLSDALRHVYRTKPNLADNKFIPGDSDLKMFPNKTVKLMGSGTPDMNIGCQMFELAKNDAKVTKLEMVDTGYWSAPQGYTIRVVFAGKVFIDSVNTPCFVPIFTLIFSNNKAMNVDQVSEQLATDMATAGHTELASMMVNLHMGNQIDGINYNSGLPSDQDPDRSGLRED